MEIRENEASENNNLQDLGAEKKTAAVIISNCNCMMWAFVLI